MTVTCSGCGDTVRVRRDGRLYVHQTAGTRCAGSGLPPAPPRPAETCCRRCGDPADPDVSVFAGWCGPEHRDAGRAELRRSAARRARTRRAVQDAAAFYS